MPKVYALFVGINAYRATRPLSGCVEDIAAIETLFRSRIAPERLGLRVLRDGEATRAAIIDGFRTHLRLAGANDVACFYYCGHGSQEPCPPEWRRLEPSGTNQTIVPVDARTADVFDIADKELAALIHDVASGGAHVVVITDACHSGGNTRGVEAEDPPRGGVARMTPASMRPRTLDDYLALARELYDPARVGVEGPPRPRHVAIAACQAHELALEFPEGLPRRGVFSAAFEDAVRTLGPSATYVDLVNAVRLKVRDRAAEPPHFAEQVPTLHVSGGASGHDVFLGGQAGRRDLTIDADSAGRWWLSAGAIDGVPHPERGSATEVAIHERGALDASVAAPIATGIIVAVLKDRAQLKVRVGGAPLDPSRQYVGAITRLGTPALHVVVAAGDDSDARQRVRSYLSGQSATFAVTDGPARVPTVTVAVHGERMDVCGDDGVPFAGLRFALDAPGLAALSACCAHLARWYAFREGVPAGSLLNDRVCIDLVPVAPGEKTVPDDRPPYPVTHGQVALQYEGDTGPRVQIRLRNTSDERLYVGLIDLSDTFECSTLFADWIPAGGVGFVGGGKAFRMQVPSWRDASVRSATDDLKAVAAITDFDPERWTMPARLGPPTRQVIPADEDDDAAALDSLDAFWGCTLLKVVTTR